MIGYYEDFKVVLKKGKVTLQWLPIKDGFNEMIIYKAINGDKPMLWRSLTTLLPQLKIPTYNLITLISTFLKSF